MSVWFRIRWMGDVADPVGKRNVGQAQADAKPQSAENHAKTAKKSRLRFNGSKIRAFLLGAAVVLHCGGSHDPVVGDVRRRAAWRLALATMRSPGTGESR